MLSDKITPDSDYWKIQKAWFWQPSAALSRECRQPSVMERLNFSKSCALFCSQLKLSKCKNHSSCRLLATVLAFIFNTESVEAPGYNDRKAHSDQIDANRNRGGTKLLRYCLEQISCEQQSKLNSVPSGLCYSAFWQQITRTTKSAKHSQTTANPRSWKWRESRSSAQQFIWCNETKTRFVP